MGGVSGSLGVAGDVKIRLESADWLEDFLSSLTGLGSDNTNLPSAEALG
jgi:hypothetical protein